MARVMPWDRASASVLPEEVQMMPPQLEFWPKKAEWEGPDGFARVVINSSNFLGYVRHFRHGGFCEVTHHKLTTTFKCEKIKRWVEPKLDELDREVRPGRWVHDMPFVPEWLACPAIRTFRELSFDMYNTDASLITAVPRPLASRLALLGEPERAKRMAFVDGLFADAIPDAEQREYTKDWFANILQHPTERGRSGVGLIFSGMQGVGKNMFADWFRLEVLGPALTACVSLRRAFDKHSTAQKLRVLLVINEIDRKGCVDAMEDLKKLLTDPTVEIDEKFLDRRELPNLTSLLMTTNNDEMVELPAGERRMCIIDFENRHRGDAEYWAAARRRLYEPGTAAALIQTWVFRDLAARAGAWQVTRPISQSYVEQQQAQINEFFGFLSMMCEMHLSELEQRARAPELFVGRAPPAAAQQFQAANLFVTFRDWMERLCGLEAERVARHNVKNVCQRLLRIETAAPGAVGQRKSNGLSLYMLSWAPLAEHLKGCGKWDRILCTVALDIEPPLRGAKRGRA